MIEKIVQGKLYSLLYSLTLPGGLRLSGIYSLYVGHRRSLETGSDLGNQGLQGTELSELSLGR
jgi:hypothetical protein